MQVPEKFFLMMGHSFVQTVWKLNEVLQESPRKVKAICYFQFLATKSSTINKTNNKMRNILYSTFSILARFFFLRKLVDANIQILKSQRFTSEIWESFGMSGKTLFSIRENFKYDFLFLSEKHIFFKFLAQKGETWHLYIYKRKHVCLIL